MERGDKTRISTIVSTLLLAMVLLSAGKAAAGVIFVTTLEDKIGTDPEFGGGPGCSLQEAIFSANLDDSVAIRYTFDGDSIFVPTECAAGNGDDTIVLPTESVFLLNKIVDDAPNPFGPTATPMVSSNVTIEAHGATLQFVPSANNDHHWHPQTFPVSFRAFAVGSTGRLTIRSAYIKGFVMQGGTGGFISDAAGVNLGGGGGGGGMGAGGAIYVHAGRLVVENTTFDGNGAIGGDGGFTVSDAGGGGGGLGGWGGPNACHIDGGGGGGGGGSRGDGAGVICGGLGGGTVFSGYHSSDGDGGFDCGGGNGWPDGNGQDAPCPGGGGGGGGDGSNGGQGNYGGGGGGGGDGGNGGNGGFGAGGGAGRESDLFGSSGGNGGFGGGGGAGPDGPVTDGDPGQGGMFGGDANHDGGGGGAGLGGAIFNDAGNVVVRNSTFTNNFVARGVGGGFPNAGHADNGGDAGGAIFTVNGHLTVLYSTISGNEATGSGGGVVVVQTDADAPTSFTLHNTIVANNGANECSTSGDDITSEFSGNLIQDNDGCGGVVSSDDPLLAALSTEPGAPTMAIPTNSPAFNAADPGVTLPRDERGQDRPAMGGYDIGAFELCLMGPFLPCPLSGGLEGDLVSLTIQVSPVGTGTTTPAPGNYVKMLNSVVALTATPSAGYRFVDWTGGVAVPSNAVTTVVMDDSKTITANFALIPDFSFGAVAPLVLPVGGSGSTTVTVNANATFDQPVALSASGQPAGASPSLTPASVTPPAGGMASSMLQMNLGPSLLPGSYLFNVNGTSGALMHSTPVSLTVNATSDGATAVIDELEALGCIDNAGIANGFSVKLAQAQAAIDAGDIQTAINILTALLHQIQAQTGKHLETSCTDGNGLTFDPAEILIADVQALLAELGAGVPGPHPLRDSRHRDRRSARRVLQSARVRH